MADLFVRGAANDAAGGVSSITVSIDGTGCDLCVICPSYNPTDDTISSVTYNGVVCSLVDSSSDGTNTKRAAAYQLKNPATGVNNAVVNFSVGLAHSSSAGVHMFNGTDPTTPLGTAQKATATSGTASVTLTSIGASNSGFDAVCAQPSSSINTPTQTQSFVDNTPQICIGGSHAAGNASRTFQWTISAATIWAQIAFEVFAPSAVVTPPAVTNIMGHMIMVNQ